MFHWCLGYLFLALLSGALGYGDYHTKMDGLARYMAAVFTTLFALSITYSFWRRKTTINRLIRKDF
ncbi:MAG: hypothetical protein VX583_08395 [Bdellovibrionota bacterium]|mgnify:FL=1|nr:hypothetical protein [Pseudobdellovibrionaceae bacterium]|tara:strand:+ start:27701 stop:27898 length:198 start_codon:yes stop_codon:yes gene_type:complete